MKINSLSFWAIIAGCLLFSSLAQAQTYYADRASFQSANPGLDLETFNNGTVPPGGVCSGPAPWNATGGGAPCFGIGDLLGAVEYDIIEQPNSSFSLASLGSGFGGLGSASPVIGANTFVDFTTLTFSDPTNVAVAFDLYCLGGPVSIDIYGAGGLIDTEVRPCNFASPTFFGVNAGEAITEIVLQAAQGELIDDLEFNGELAGPPPARATFAVWKDFDDDNPAEVLVTLSCNTGLPLEQSKLITDNDAYPLRGQADGFFVGDPPVNFVVVDFTDGQMDCEITEEVPDGYSVQYVDAIGSNSTSCSFDDIPHGGAHTCQINNSLQRVDVDVTKVWIDENPQFEASNVAEANWFCSNVAFGNNSGLLDFNGNPDTRTFSVYPSWNGGTDCEITETFVADGGVEIDDSDCDSVLVFPGEGGSCTIFNTRLYEGIPTLSQYGLAVLALLMLGIGFVGFRRMI